MGKEPESNLVLITGSDPEMIGVKAKEVVRGLAGDDPDAFALDIIQETDDVQGAEVLHQVVRSLRSPPFFGNRKTVWLCGFTKFAAEGGKGAGSEDGRAFHALYEVLKQGLPQDMALVMSGPDADQRRQLARTCKAKGQVIVCAKPQVRDRHWEQEMRRLIAARAAAKKVALPEPVCDYLVDVLGTDTGRIDGELEKLICYVGGPEQPLTLAAAEAVCSGTGETVSWALTDALGRRDLAEVLRVVDVVLRTSKDPDKAARGLLLQVARHMRYLLQIRVFMQQRNLQRAKAVRAVVTEFDEEERNGCQRRGLEFVAFHPYRIGSLAQQACNYEGRELVQAIPVLRDAHRDCVTGVAADRVILENAAMRIVRKHAGAH